MAPCTNVAFADVDVTVPSGSAPSYVCVNAVNVTGVPNSDGECSRWQEPQRLVVIRGFLIATTGADIYIYDRDYTYGRRRRQRRRVQVRSRSGRGVICWL